MRSSLLLSGLLGFTVFSAAANVSRGRFNDRKVLTPEVDAFINQILADWNTAGGAGVAVVRLDDQGEWVVETKGYGVAKADGTPVNPDTIFPIGSNSKVSSFCQV
jgi:CubicO group peptidase (beta-lactamase class C family)